ncbi:MAG: myo-inosose-2 dehydratase [Coxiellaceae bacterium]|nr:myo-inosose-2 dehydratase [Coxiellaceae bacterium]
MRKNVKLGIAPYCWINDDMPELGADITIDQCVKEIALAGFDGCELANRFPSDAEAILSLVNPHQLQVANQWFSTFLTTPGQFEKTLEDFSNHCVKLARCGASIVGVSEQTGSIQSQSLPLCEDHRPQLNETEWALLIDGLHHMGGIAQQFGITLTYHHHMGTSIQSQQELCRLMDDSDPSLVHLLYDSGHFVYADIDPLWVLQQYGDRIAHVHLKDCRFDKLEQVKQQGLSFLDGVRMGTFTVPGDGDIDFLPLFKQLQQADYSGWLIIEAEQDPAIAHPLTYATKGYQHLNQLLDQISTIKEASKEPSCMI